VIYKNQIDPKSLIEEELTYLDKDVDETAKTNATKQQRFK
jgi:hypothetical protein